MPTSGGVTAFGSYCSNGPPLTACGSTCPAAAVPDVADPAGGAVIGPSDSSPAEAGVEAGDAPDDEPAHAARAATTTSPATGTAQRRRSYKAPGRRGISTRAL